MCARSQTSGLISVECAASTSASDRSATTACVRSRASARSSVWLAVVAVTGRTVPEPLLGPSAPGAAPHLDDLADGGGAPGDARVKRPDDQLEAPRLQLLELSDQRVEATALLVDQHDVAGADALRRRALRLCRRRRGGRDVEEGVAHGRGTLGAVPDG